MEPMNSSDEPNNNIKTTLGVRYLCSCSDHSRCVPVYGGQRMKKLFLVVMIVAATTGCSPTGPVFTVADRAGLGAFLAFEIVGNAGNVAPPAPDGSPAPSGSVCPECNGVGKVGDGTVMLTCNECGGTGKVPGSVEEEMQQLEDLKEEDELTFEDMVTDITCLDGPSWFEASVVRMLVMRDTSISSQFMG